MDFPSHLATVLIFGLGLLLAEVTTGVNSYNQYVLEPEHDICDPKTDVTNPNSVYLPDLESSTEVYIDTRSKGSQPANIDCLLYIKTCDNCRIAVEHVGFFSYPACMLNVPPDGDTGSVCVPNCVYFYLFEAGYRSQTTKAFDSSPVSYKSESKQLHIIACGMNYNGTINMRLRLTVKEKLLQITYSRASPYSQDVFTFVSPFFPSPFAKNSEFYTYKLQSREPNTVMVVSFDDWMLTPSSYLEFYTATDETMVTGSQDRPLIESTGPNLTVNFFTGGSVSGQSSFLGFKAKVAFISNHVNVIKPSTACDQDISSEGGIIRLTIPDGQMKDCIFVIRKISRFDGVYLGVLKTQSEGQHDTLDYEFDIYSGITSMGELKGQFHRNDPVQNSSVFVSSDGFYIRYVGQYYDGSSHLLAYAMYLYSCDEMTGYFRCRNDRCIALALKCDGFDHCGDGSDEYSGLCTYTTTHSSSSYPLSIGIIIPIVVSLFLIIVVCVLIIFIRRCRRLSNEARARRPPGPCSHRQRVRHNRDVQMSVTLRSGEHPPSYDEVLQNTPIGYLNMAFTWSQHGNMAQPPSYEEAVSPTSHQNGSIIITATANSGHEEATRTSRQNSSTVLTTTISASLDPRAEVSSSSSSEDVPDQFRQFDLSSSSESSVENEHRLIPNGHLIDGSRSNLNLTKDNKELNQDAGSQRSSPKYSNNQEGAQVVLRSPGFVKVNSDGQERITPVMNKRIELSDGSRHENSASREQLNVKDIRDQQQSFGDLRNVTGDRESQGVLPAQRLADRSGGAQSHVLSGSEAIRDADRESKQGRGRVDMYQKNKGKHSHRNVDRENEGDRRHGTPGDGLRIHLPKVTDTSRSQSCFDLSLGTGSAGLLDGSRARMREEDKRFSYAGVGDTSLARDGIDNVYSGRGLFRERPREHLDRYATQSYENIRDMNTIRSHDKLGYEEGSEQGGLPQHRQNRSSESAGYFPKSTRDKIDSQRARGQYSNLAPVKENLHGEAQLPVFTPDAGHRDTYSGHTDGQLDHSSSDNNWSQHRRNPLESARVSSQANPNSYQKTSTQPRGSSHEHLLPGSSRSLPSDRMASVPSHNYVNRHDHRKPSSKESRRKQTELHSSRSNVGDFQNNPEHNSKNNAANSDLQGDTGHSRSSGSLARSDHQDTTASLFKPKPSLRKSRMKAAQQSGGHAAESLPHSSSQGHMQASHRPVPAPRQAIRKQEPVDGRGPPTPAAPDSRSLQGTSRSWSGQNERGDEGCLPVTDQINSRNHINVEATSDDVFV